MSNGDLPSRIQQDSETDVSRQNELLAGYLRREWNPYKWVKIERIERANDGAAVKGWQGWYEE